MYIYPGVPLLGDDNQFTNFGGKCLRQNAFCQQAMLLALSLIYFIAAKKKPLKINKILAKIILVKGETLKYVLPSNENGTFIFEIIQ